MKVVLEVNDVSVSYGEAAPALRQISMSLREHELVAVLGANGAGKSTLLRAISGLVPLRGGRIYFQGNDITELSPSKRVGLGIVHVPEGRQMLQGLTVHENLLASLWIFVGSVGPAHQFLSAGGEELKASEVAIQDREILDVTLVKSRGDIGTICLQLLSFCGYFHSLASRT